MFKAIIGYFSNQATLGEAWRDYKKGRFLSAERKVLDVNLSRMRAEFERNAKTIATTLKAQTPDGLHERDSYNIKKDVLGLQIGGLKPTRYHLMQITRPEEITSSKHSKSIERLAKQFGLQASFKYANSDFHTEVGEAYAASKLFLTLSRQ